jgi:hypothetical protein
MSARKRRTPNLLANRTAAVSLYRNGLTIQIESVPATDCALVAQALLDAMRNLVEAGYSELVQEGPSLHAGALGEIPEEAEDEEAKGRRIGFTA